MPSYLRSGIAAAILLAGSPVVAALAQDVIGIPTIYVTQQSDTLLDVARTYDLGFVEVRAANPGVDPWLPGAGRELTLPTQFVLPAGRRRGIVINLAELRLYYFPSKGEPRSFPVGIGREGFETPVGSTRVARKRVHPVWIPTAGEHEENPDLPASVGPGPDNPMGDYALYLGWSGYAVHGTNRPYSIGRRGSHGCIRLYPEDIEVLFRLASIGEPVTVVDQPAKVGWAAGQLYLEVHPEQREADALESKGVPRSPIAVEADALVLKASGLDAGRIDWYSVHLAEAQRTGVAVQVTRPVPY
jgi:L,D-transpeptidase ErfK/SrfK